jgi:hypothetical protein
LRPEQNALQSEGTFEVKVEKKVKDELSSEGESLLDLKLNLVLIHSVSGPKTWDFYRFIEQADLSCVLAVWYPMGHTSDPDSVNYVMICREQSHPPGVSIQDWAKRSLMDPYIQLLDGLNKSGVNPRVIGLSRKWTAEEFRAFAASIRDPNESQSLRGCIDAEAKEVTGLELGIESGDQ